MENKSGPTLNDSYNDLLARWQKNSDPSIQPECESCGCDLTGKEVFETRTMWVCDRCREDVLADDAYYVDDYREDFHSDG